MYKKLFLSIFFITLFSGCAKHNKVNELFQTNKAVEIANDYKEILSYLNTYKVKLDKRNPKQFNKDLKVAIHNQINSLNNIVSLKNFDNEILINYKQYLDMAFSSKNVYFRNDYLILGMYYMIYDSYSLKEFHKFTALNYNKEKLQNLYKNLHILRWRIKTAKNSDGKYLFLTWQNNWQVEFINKNIKNLNEINELTYIKTAKESILSPSNFSFEVLISLMILRVEDTLKNIGSEPSQITIDTIKSLVFII
ncbi:hypothetical protein [Malaciobacter mytili]|uniref:Lipoprotein n=1 Tax=Malaciobacter mytili LMG 24559 TaxID=1032238 RepID=A0AAX2ACP3_9BACT|nr:hypothetical protein [Malaciobacter mytili]AXH14264.1 hypothetical protein AMYT_0670 [Malaciobacter mytili LMG 24559]RXK13855.1 hypothetical protein CP985_12380 [Malaciobacter mytili LMG 24559]